jgi:HEPN domain-containing protein
MTEIAKAWVIRAQEDLAVATHAEMAGWYATACFHAQQAGEKFLKAVLIAQGVAPLRSHDLDALADRLETWGSVTAIREATMVLTAYAVSVR